MEARCTCGTVLPADARFCHKCGKPQFEEDVKRMEGTDDALPSQTASAVTAALNGPKIGFSNSRAVWISLLVAAACLLALGIIGFAGLFAQLLEPILLCGAGFVAVLLYKRRTAEPVNARAGARLGWMTGLWLFLAMAILAALVSVVISDPGSREQMKRSMPGAPEVAKMLDDPHQFLMMLMANLVSFFFLVIILPGLGGILGARILKGRRSS